MASVRFLLMTCIVLVCCQFAHPKADPKNSHMLDTAAIHRIYLEGDFDVAIDRVETALRYGGPFSHEDSIFIFKHLGVMYAAKYETREMGKQNMLRLLQVEPTARILDMYASDMIYMIFKNIQDEFDMSRTKQRRAEGNLRSDRDAATEGQESKESKGGPRDGKSDSGSGKTWIGWTVGAIAAAGGVALFVHLSEENAKPARRENVLQ